MKEARAIRKRGFTHTVEIRGGDHVLTADEPRKEGGNDEGPSPQELLAASLASCTAITIEMYAKRKGWNIGEVEVDVDYEPAQRGSPTKFHQVIRLPNWLGPKFSMLPGVSSCLPTQYGDGGTHQRHGNPGIAPSRQEEC